MIKTVILAVLIAVAVADSGYRKAYPAKAEEVVYPPQPYSFDYNVKDAESYNDFVHSENSDGKVTQGSYRIALPDGRTQIVTYRADENGNVADVTYEGYAKYPEYVEPQYKAYPKY